MTRPAALAHSTLERHYYVSEEAFAQEREQIFERSWLYALRTEGLQARGSYALAELCGESVILVRGDDGALRAFYNVCRHRGTRLCEAASGRFAGAIVCPYHAWTYGLDGRLQAARNMDDVPGFERSDYPLHEVAVEEVSGFAFLNFSNEPARRSAPSAAAFLRPLEGKFARWDIADLVAACSLTYDLACNWKLIVQNYSECYHCPVIHPQLVELSPWDSGSNDLCEGGILGGPMRLRPAHETMSVTGARPRPPVGSVDGDDLRRVYYYAIFPAMLFSLHPDYVMVHRIEPLAVDRSRVVCEWLFARDVAAAPDFDPRDVIDFWDLTNRQDWHVCELSQRGVASRVYRPSPYAGPESMLAAFDDHYRSVMENL